jgi:hypothetical protein
VSSVDSRDTVSEILATRTRQDFVVSRVDQAKQLAKIDMAQSLVDRPRDLVPQNESFRHVGRPGRSIYRLTGRHKGVVAVTLAM